MKLRKVELVKEGFDIAQVSDPIWFLEPGAGTYVPLGPEQMERLRTGGYRL
jgi:hypothetical protein